MLVRSNSRRKATVFSKCWQQMHDLEQAGHEGLLTEAEVGALRAIHGRFESQLFPDRVWKTDDEGEGGGDGDGDEAERAFHYYYYSKQQQQEQQEGGEGGCCLMYTADVAVSVMYGYLCGANRMLVISPTERDAARIFVAFCGSGGLTGHRDTLVARRNLASYPPAVVVPWSPHTLVRCPGMLPGATVMASGSYALWVVVVPPGSARLIHTEPSLAYNHKSFDTLVVYGAHLYHPDVLAAIDETFETDPRFPKLFTHILP